MQQPWLNFTCFSKVNHRYLDDQPAPLSLDAFFALEKHHIVTIDESFSTNNVTLSWADVFWCNMFSPSFVISGVRQGQDAEEAEIDGLLQAILYIKHTRLPGSFLILTDSAALYWLCNHRMSLSVALFWRTAARLYWLCNHRTPLSFTGWTVLFVISSVY